MPISSCLFIDYRISGLIGKMHVNTRDTEVPVLYTTKWCFFTITTAARREEVVLARLRLGHTRFTHSYLLQGEELPQCVGCDTPFTVRHFLLECGDFAQVRNNCFHVDNMKELFQDIHIDSIMTFLRQINLFNKI